MNAQSSTPARDFTERLDVVSTRLAEHASSEPHPAGMTNADAETGERWDAGQVWAHLAEIIPYWISQTKSVIASYSGEAVPFGRIKSDPQRIRAIEQGRSTPLAAQWTRVEEELAALRAFITGVDEPSWAAEGVHAKRGVMPVARIVDDFLVSHLEEHADQLDLIAALPGVALSVARQSSTSSPPAVTRMGFSSISVSCGDASSKSASLRTAEPSSALEAPRAPR